MKIIKRAVILHGTDANPNINWFQWLKAKLEASGYEVWVPSLPNNHTPNAAVYNDFLFDSGWDFADNLIIGHSSGAVSVLNLLSDARCPKIDTAILVSAWAHMEGTKLDPVQFKDLFPADGFDFEKIRAKAEQFLLLHSDDDPHCPYEQAQWMAAQLHGKLLTIVAGHHLGTSRTPMFPELLDILNRKRLV